MNSITLTGRITKTPEAKQKQDNSGLYCFFTIAVDDGKDKDGNKQASFIDCIAYDKQASFLSNYIKKGYLIGVNGSLHVSSRTDENGVITKRATVKAWAVENLQPREQAQQGAPRAPEPTPEPTPAPTSETAPEGFSLPFEI